VISTFGPASNRQPGTLISRGIANIVAGCLTGGISRFVFERGLMVSAGRELSVTGRAAVRMVGLLSVSPQRVSDPQSRPSAHRSTTPWPRRSTASTRPS
jgi:hypothetical protein